MAAPKKPVKRTPARTSVSRSKSSSKTLKNSRFSRNQLIAFVLVFAVIGGAILYRSFAAPPAIATLQGEGMQVGCLGGCGSSVIADKGASGGQATRLATNTSLSSYLTIPSTATSVSVVARGTSCSGGWPFVTLTVAGNTTLPATKVGSTSWKSYTTTTNIPAGTYYVWASSSNNGVINSSCSRHLDIDSITFYGPDTATPPPGSHPPVGVGTVGIPYTCNGRVSGLKISGTGHATGGSPSLITLGSGCTGSLSFNITADNHANDGIKVLAGAHDLSIGASSFTCTPELVDDKGVGVYGNHQDGVQVQGGTNVTFRNLTVNCPDAHGAGAFYVDGKDFSGISNVICDGCDLRHYVIPFIYTTSSGTAGVVNSGVRNSTLHMSPFQANRCFTTPSGGTVGLVNTNNTCVP